MSDNSKGLGRLPVSDRRDQRFPMRARLNRLATDEAAQEALDRGYRYWYPRGWWGDQGSTPQCVAYAALHALEDGPVTLEDRSPESDPIMDPEELYRMAQARDEWPGENYDGTSARGAAKALLELGVIREYRWVTTVSGLVDTVLRYGPVLFGSIWLSGMDELDEDGFISISGHMRGGHQTEVNGVNVNQQKLRLKNSWGREWGDDGHFWMTFDDAAFLLERAAGDACVLVQ